jgi:hypothetical protein
MSIEVIHMQSHQSKEAKRRTQDRASNLQGAMVTGDYRKYLCLPSGMNNN